jgi:hypothetical protein
VSSRYRLHLESLDARIVPDGGNPGYPGGGYPPPSNGGEGSGQVQFLLGEYSNALNQFNATVSQYGAAIEASIKARTEYLWYSKIATDTLATLIRLEQSGAAEPAMLASLQVQLAQANAGVVARQREWAEKFDAAVLVHREFEPILARLQTYRNMISNTPGGNDAFYARYGTHSHQVTVPEPRTSSYVVAQAQERFERGEGRP